MANFKVGQNVVCIKHAPEDIETGEINPAPKEHEIVKIRAISFDGWLTFFGYPFDIEYEPWNFRPLDHQFAEDVIAMITEKELVLTNT